MVAIALVGADGAGKTTVGRELERAADPPVKYLYMGVNPHASNVALPTTRFMQGLRRVLGREVDAGGPPDPAARHSGTESKAGGVGRRRWLRSIKRSLVLVNRVAEEWYRQLVSWWYQRRGYVVLYDRHFYADYHAHDVNGAGLELSRRIHGFLLQRFYPRPDLLIVLDAPADVLWARKPEGTPELLELRRREYLELAERESGCAIVDASRSSEQVTRDVARLVRDAARAAKRDTNGHIDGNRHADGNRNGGRE